MIGLTLGVYAALALRDFVYGEGTILWGVLWKAETDWLPFLTLVTVLVFWQAGLYAERERRAGFGRVVGSLALIGVITLISLSAPATGSRRTAWPRRRSHSRQSASACCAGATTSSPATSSSWPAFADGRSWSARGEPGRLHKTLGQGRGGIDYDFVGAVGRVPTDDDGLPTLGRLEALPAVLARNDVNELIVTDSDYNDRELVDIVEHAHRRGGRCVSPRGPASS